MTINWWTLGLQAVNVLILIWLLSRVFWHPVAKAIAARQGAAQKMLSDAEATQKKANSALAEVTKTRAGMVAERGALLTEVKVKADAAAKAALKEASRKAENVLKAAKIARKREIDVARVKAAADSAQLAVDIARKLLARLDTGEVQVMFLDLLVESIEQMPPTDRAALVDTAGGIDLFSPSDLKAADKAKITKAVRHALGGAPELHFVTDPDLIAGFELRTAHFVLHNSWQSDLAAILKDQNNEA